MPDDLHRLSFRSKEVRSIMWIRPPPFYSIGLYLFLKQPYGQGGKIFYKNEGCTAASIEFIPNDWKIIPYHSLKILVQRIYLNVDWLKPKWCVSLA